MKIQFFETTRQGARQNNQDAYAHVVAPDWGCFIVADGLGGHDKGEVASYEFCQAIRQLVGQFAEQIIKDDAQGLLSLTLAAGKSMREQVFAQYGNIDSQTTFALLWLDAQKMMTAHVGDSRIYRLKEGQILWRTPDHTPVQELYEKGLIGEEEFGTHPLQNRLLRAVNLYEDPNPDIFIQPALDKEETILLCTDGFWNALSTTEILTLAATKHLDNTASQLMDNIEKNHPKDGDNITVQIIRLNHNLSKI